MVSRYMDATQQQQSALRGGTMEVDIDANVPKMKTQGKLHALKSISKLGKITYHALGFSGDNSVKTEVIARYLKAEVDAAQNGQNFSVTPANYKFKYKGMEERDGRDLYVLHVTPRQKKVGLFKGELWVDAQTYLPVRESGSFVKTPSFFLKKMQFVRDYDIQNGVSVPQHLESKADVRIFGPVELSVNYFKFSRKNLTPQRAQPAIPSSEMWGLWGHVGRDAILRARVANPRRFFLWPPTPVTGCCCYS